MDAFIGSNKQHQLELDWTQYEEVMNNYEALAFKSWMGVDDDSSEHPLRLHFAIVAYKEMAASEDEWHCQLAKEIWREFLKPKTGLCAFIESKIRDKIGRTLRQFCIQSKEGQLQQQLQCGGSKQLPLPIELFDDCLPSLDHYLREQHKLFLGSYELIEYLNNSANANNDSLRFAAMMMAGDDAIIESNNNNNNIDGNQQQQQSHGNRRIFPSSRRSGSLQRHHQNHHQMEQQFNQTTTIPLTAEFLLRTQYDRETLVAENSMVQKLFKPVTKFPYVANAHQTSKNDSAVSSSFSNDTHGSRRGKSSGLDVRVIRDNQMRYNKMTALHLPKIDASEGAALGRQATSQFEHNTPEGRCEFAAFLTKQLQEVQRRQIQTDNNEQELERITEAAHEPSKTSARELIIHSEVIGGDLEDESAATADADNDVENYFRQKMVAESTTSQQSPAFPQSRRTRRKSLRSCSPFEKQHLDQQHQQYPPPSTTMSSMAATQTYMGTAAYPVSMTQSSFLPSTTTSVIVDHHQKHYHHHQHPNVRALINVAEEAACKKRHNHHQSKSPMPQNHHQSQAANFADCHNDITASSFLLDGTTPSGQPQQQQPPIKQLFNNLYLGTPLKPSLRNMPGGIHCSAEGPSFKNSPPYCCGDNDGDTSGIGSMTTTHISDTSNSSALTSSRRRAAFRKASELSENSSESQTGQQQPPFFRGGNFIPEFQQQQQMRSKKMVGTVHQQQQQPHQHQILSSPFGTMPRSRVSAASAACLPPHSHHPQNPQLPMMTISYRDSGNKGVPHVSNVPQRPITLKEFRRHFAIPSRDKRQFFFKSACEDLSAPYQLTLITDEAALLPVFEGSITAECRPTSDSD